MTTHTVGEVAAMSGVTVRTLHHYDDIGLLSPAGRTESGYRLYDEHDIDRLRDILAFRELGLGLDEIAEAISTTGDPAVTLRRARSRLRERIEHLEAVVRSLDAAIVANEGGTTLSAEEKLSVFGDFDPAQYEAEVEERWGDTDAYRTSAARTASYTKEDWARITAEADGIYARAGELAAADADPAGGAARRLVEDHRAHISAYYYECTPEIHAGLGQVYEADPRFTETIDAAGPGAAALLSAAIGAYYGASG
jgi:DNA-binding transcriptional MerR regulator